jgi:hypothetical protein
MLRKRRRHQRRQGRVVPLNQKYERIKTISAALIGLKALKDLLYFIVQLLF